MPILMLPVAQAVSSIVSFSLNIDSLAVERLKRVATLEMQKARRRIKKSFLHIPFHLLSILPEFL
jgi:hypothetical protein